MAILLMFIFVFRNIYKEKLSFLLSMNKGAKAFKLKCPECDADIEVPEDAISGEIVSCPDCGLDLEVKIDEEGLVSLKPAEIEGEDWGE
jgi:alpha-aminoadipate carrier protein LysW